jgi:iron complex outermembrane receptor protein
MKNSRIRVALCSGTAFLALTCAGSAWAQSKSLDIPSEDAGKSIPELARQGGVQIVAPGRELHGVVTPAVSGSYDVRVALVTMLKGTGMSIAADDGQTIVLAAQTANPQNTVAQNAGPTVTATSEGRADEVVVVTGTRGKERTVTTSATPVDVITGSEIQQVGQASVLTALSNLVPSFNEPFRAGGSTATVIETGGLRGLNPDETLVLVNGKRRHKTALINAVSTLYNGSVPVDLDLIPTSAIDHIEVLRDGAAAQYGSDAIAGVINIILKNDTKGADLTATAGQNMDRSDGQIITELGHIGFNLDDKGFLDLSATAKEQFSSNRAIPISPSINLYNLINGQRDPREATINRLVTVNYGQMPQETFDSAYNGDYQLGGDMEVYSFGTMSHRVSDLNFTFRAPNNVASLPQIYPNGFYPRLIISEWDYESALGVRGTLDGWSWDLSTSFGTDQAGENADRTLNASLGPTSPTAFYVGKIESTEWVNSLDITRGFPIGGGSLQVSTGLQHRQERYDILAGDAASSAAGTYVIPTGQPMAGQHPPPEAQAVGGISTSDAGHLSRNNLAAYIDLAYDPTDQITIGAAGRFEHYDDASGNALIGKIDGRYAVTPWLAFRADINSGFRAPALAQELWASTTSQFQLVGTTLNLLEIKALPVASPAAVALGATPLKPETSMNYSAGVVLTPLPDLDVTIDAYSIDVYKRIEPTGTFTGAAVTNILAAQGLPSNLSVTYFTNAINTRTQGLDFVSSYRLDLSDWGQMRLSASMNYNVNSITHIIPNPVQLASLGANYVIFDRLSQGNLTVGLPKTKISFGDVWTWSDFTLSPRFIRYGAITQLQDTASQDRSYNAKWITDLELAWQVTPTYNIAVGADNLFNVYPSANGIFNTSTGSGQYPGTSPFGFTGGFYYGKLTITL